ncbi:carnosine N-methyltransferase [Bacillus rossius redtenbacheri]|uniref:carnosine N-methyltransferase n=1 Tax=Bacillus rossius redtenbacheri TaxID=93214 RepID=UPI002FDCB017
MFLEMSDIYCNSSFNNNVKQKQGNVHDDEAEKAHFHKIIGAFKQYRSHSLQRVSRTEQYFLSLPAHHQNLLKKFQINLHNIRECVERNSEIIKLIIKDAANMFENVPLQASQVKVTMPANMADQEKVQITLKQFVRDWSREGATERATCYQPIIREILELFPPAECSPAAVKVLVPGAGLGRLAFEIARLGYNCQGNEFSLFMLFASNFVLNKCEQTNIHTVYPWVHQYVNNLRLGHQTKGVAFPDVNPSDLPREAQFSMIAGDFLEVYTEPCSWDCVSTCFFIDCANNVVAFIETIYKILKPGGVWINLGPLYYHFADMPTENSIEPTYEELRDVISGIGFEMKKEDTNMRTTYTQNPMSMLQYEYTSVFFVCVKPACAPHGTAPAGGRR